MKYAFPEEQTGTVRIELRVKGSEATLKISDDGIGLPAEMDIAQNKSLGLQLVSALSEQLGGKLQVLKGPGSAFKLKFKFKK